MRILILSVYYILLKEIFCELIKLKLEYTAPYYYISLIMGKNINETKFLFSNNIPISFIPTSNCKICSKFKLNETNSNLVSIKQNIKIPHYHYDYTGNIYKNTFSVKNLTSELNFIGFSNVTYKSDFSYNGIFALSFLNYNFNTTKKIFAIKFEKSDCYIHLGDYNSNIIKKNDTLKIFNITVDDKEMSGEVLNSKWYINFSSLLIGDVEINNNKNNESNSSVKLSFDMGTNKFHIPKDYFFKNMKFIFPAKSQCQFHPDGYFICVCQDNYNEVFGKFEFRNNNNEVFTINPSDYIKYEFKMPKSECIAKIMVNYKNDLFIVGTEILKKYYTIFDIDNKTLTLYKEEKNEIPKDMEFFILFLFILAIIETIIFGIYFCWKKCKTNPRNIDEAEEIINQGQNESSEETD